MATDKVQEEVTNEDLKELILDLDKKRQEDMTAMYNHFENRFDKVDTKLEHLQNGQTKTNKRLKKLATGQKSMLERLDSLEVGQGAIVHCLTEVDNRVNELREEGFGEKPNSPIGNLYDSKVKESQTSDNSKKQSKRKRKKGHSTQ